MATLNGKFLPDSLRNLLETYYDFNSTTVDELEDVPSALEFMRYVGRNRPFVVRRGARDWQAFEEWNAAYLERIMADSKVNVAITPFGNADAIVEEEDGKLVYVEPLEQQETFADVLRYIQKSDSGHFDGPVKYAQTQNDNLRNEYEELFSDVPSEMSFARIALEKQPDAVNFWLGNSRSVTSLHKDNYENIYAQIRGQKHFVLMPPVYAPCVNEQTVPLARYAQVDGTLQHEPTHPSQSVPVPTWDPDMPEQRSVPLSKFAQPMYVTLDEGDMMYLPAMWYHKVSQSCGREGFSCSVNYWYDMDFDGQFWATNSLVRNLALGSDAATGTQVS
ncbi:hypothetical protein MBLNU457_3939t1 [Dothideomycetes sp. NU457]